MKSCGVTVAACKLDELDFQIIAELRRDGRQANTEIARHLGTTEAKVRSRIQRLTKAEIIQIAALTNTPRLGLDLDILIGVHCDANRIKEVGRTIAAMDEVRYVGCVSGRYDLWVAVSFRSRAELFHFLTERLGTIPGVQKMETMHVLEIMKRVYDYHV